ncbi:hypothetical protein HYT05_05125 [Candidatus Kaiserbacteria bacterium]|nr:hypothetical protein [Candidatus Kaiserbacteria bacterium]
MDLTIHSVERIQDRTSMRVRDVLALVSQNAFVRLGSDNGYEYLLFYSRPDGDVKVAVVDKDRKRLISVWEKHFNLPRGVARVTPGRIRRARELWGFYAVTQRTASRKKEWRFKITLEVVIGQKTVFAHECGYMPVHKVSSLDTALPHVMSYLESIVPVIESRTDINKAQVRYDFWYTHELSFKRQRLNIMHSDLKERMKVA